MKSFAKLKKIKGDASCREFYRNKVNKSIIVISKKEKLKNLLIYDAINKILIKNKILKKITKLKLRKSKILKTELDFPNRVWYNLWIFMSL